MRSRTRRRRCAQAPSRRVGSGRSHPPDCDFAACLEPVARRRWYGPKNGANPMPRTLFDKIWEAHRVAQRADGRELIYIDRHVLHELHAPHAFEALEQQHRPVRRPDLTFSALDHTVATKPGRTDNTNPSGEAFIKAMRE